MIYIFQYYLLSVVLAQTNIHGKFCLTDSMTAGSLSAVKTTIRLHGIISTPSPQFPPLSVSVSPDTSCKKIRVSFSFKLEGKLT